MPEERATVLAELFDGSQVLSVSTPDNRHIYRWVRADSTLVEAGTLLEITQYVFGRSSALVGAAPSRR